MHYKLAQLQTEDNYRDSCSAHNRDHRYGKPVKPWLHRVIEWNLVMGLNQPQWHVTCSTSPPATCDGIKTEEALHTKTLYRYTLRESQQEWSHELNEESISSGRLQVGCKSHRILQLEADYLDKITRVYFSVSSIIPNSLHVL